MTAISSTEGELYSVSLFGLDCVYLRRMMDMMGYTQIAATAIAQDNNACILLVKGSGMYNRSRHIDSHQGARHRRDTGSQAVQDHRHGTAIKPLHLRMSSLPPDKYEVILTDSHIAVRTKTLTDVSILLTWSTRHPDLTLFQSTLTYSTGPWTKENLSLITAVEFFFQHNVYHPFTWLST